ncbi:MAG: hypothetical protein ACRDIY_19575 [Chloroflexota bacterium]
MSDADHIEYTVQVWKEGNQYIAHAMPLDVMSSGPTPEAARQALDEAVRLFLATAAGAGTLVDALEEAGYHHRDGRWESPRWVGVERHVVTVGS